MSTTLRPMTSNMVREANMLLSYKHRLERLKRRLELSISLLMGYSVFMLSIAVMEYFKLLGDIVLIAY